MATFDNITPPACVWDGEKLNVRIPFDGDPTDMETSLGHIKATGFVPSSFQQLVIRVFNLSDVCSPLTFMVKPFEINKYIRENNVQQGLSGDFASSASAAFFNYSLAPKFNGVLPAKVRVICEENYLGGERTFDSSDVLVNLQPDAPTVAISNAFTFTDGDDNQDYLTLTSGSINVTVSSSKSLTSYKVYISGVDDNNNSVTYISTGENSISATRTSNVFPFNVASSQFVNSSDTDAAGVLFSSLSWSSDTEMCITATVEGDNYDSEFSKSVEVSVNIRKLTGVVSTVTSFKDQRLSISGLVPRAPYTSSQLTSISDANKSYYSILVLQAEKDQVVNEDSDWLLTDVIDQPSPPLSTVLSSVSLAPFKADIQKIRANDGETTDADLVALSAARGYFVCVVSHKGPFVQGMKLNPLASDSDQRPPLNQSLISNTDKSGVALNYISKTLRWKTNNQDVDDATGNLIFNPSFVNSDTSSDGVSNDLPGTDEFMPNTQESFVVTYSFKRALPGENALLVNEVSSQSGDLEIPSNNAPTKFWVAPSPRPNEIYSLDARVAALILPTDWACVQDKLPLPIVENQGFNTVVLNTYYSNVKQSRVSSQLPAPADFNLFTTRLVDGGNKYLISQHRRLSDKELAAQQLKYDGTQHQVIKALPALAQNFNENTLLNLANSGSDAARKTLAAFQEDGDVLELQPLNLFNDPSDAGTGSTQQLVPGVLYSSRVRFSYTELSSGSDVNEYTTVYSSWVYSSHVVEGLIMLPPADIDVSPYVTANNDTVLVTVTTESKEDVDGELPPVWGSNPDVIPYSVTVTLKDIYGDVVKQSTQKFNDVDLYYYSNPEDDSVDNARQQGVMEIKMSGLDLPAGKLLYPTAIITYQERKTKVTRDSGVGGGDVFTVPSLITIKSMTLKQYPAADNTNIRNKKALFGSDPSTDTTRAVDLVLNNTVLFMEAVIDNGGYDLGVASSFYAVIRGKDGDDVINQFPMDIVSGTESGTVATYSSGPITPLDTENYQNMLVGVIVIHPSAPSPALAFM
jgi:hypothetical protein